MAEFQTYGGIRVVTVDETGPGSHSATAKVYQGVQPLFTITVRYVQEKGADGGWYKVAQLQVVKEAQ